jgi:H/ACA ribonucleoprotein complex subunit 3
VISMLKKCFNGHYSLREKCPICKEKTQTPHPMKFSLSDKFGEYRRKAKLKI